MEDKELDSLFDQVLDTGASQKYRNKSTLSGRLGAFKLTREDLDINGFKDIKDEDFLVDDELQRKAAKAKLKGIYGEISKSEWFDPNNKGMIASSLYAGLVSNASRANNVLNNWGAEGRTPKEVNNFHQAFKEGKKGLVDSESLSLSDIFTRSIDEQFYLNTITGLGRLELDEIEAVTNRLKQEHNINTGFESAIQDIVDPSAFSASSIQEAVDTRLQALREQYPDIDLGINSYEDIHNAAKAKAAKIQQDYTVVQEQTGVVNTLANLAGSVVGWARDPINLVAASVMPGGVGAAGIALRAATTAGTESVIQTGVQAARPEKGLEGSFMQGAANVGVAAVGGAAAEVAFRGIGKVASKTKDKVLSVWEKYAEANKTGVEGLDNIVVDAAEQIVSDTKLNPLRDNQQLETVLDNGVKNASPSGKLEFVGDPKNVITDVPVAIKESDGAITKQGADAWNTFKEQNTLPGRPVRAADVVEETKQLLLAYEPKNQIDVLAETPSVGSVIDDLVNTNVAADPLTGKIDPVKGDQFLETQMVHFEDGPFVKERSLLEVKREFEDYARSSEVFKSAIADKDPAAYMLLKANEGYISKTRLKEIEDLITAVKGDPEKIDTLEILVKAQEIYTRRVAKRQQQASLTIDFQKKAKDQIKENLARGLSVEESIQSFSMTEPYIYIRKGFTGASFEQKFQGNKLLYGSMIAKVLNPISPKMLGTISEKKVSLEVVKDYWSLVSGKGARSADKDIRASSEAIDKLMTRGAEDFDKFGGDVVTRKDFLLGLFSNPQKMRGAAKDYRTAKLTWAEEVKRLGLDIDHIKEQLPGVKLEGKQLDMFLDKMYDGIISGGLVDVGDFIPKGLRNTANKRRAPRLLRFTSPESWLEYQTKYGQGDLFNVLSSYSDSISRDVAALQSYGPSPEAFKNNLLRESAKLDPTNASKFQSQLDVDFAYNLNSNKIAPYPTLIAIGANARSAMSAASLGSAVIPAVVNDMLIMSQLARRMRGLPALNGTGRAFKNILNPKLKQDSLVAAEMGFLNDVFMNAHRNNLSAIDNAYGSKVFKTAATGTLKLSGLIRATEAQRNAHVYELGFDLARIAKDIPIESLPERTRNWLEAFGIGRNELNLMKERALSNINYHGNILTLVDPNKLFTSTDPIDRELGQKLSGVFADFTEGVSPSYNPNAEKVWAALNKTKAGVVFGGAARNFTGYITGMWRQHMKPSLYLAKEGNMAPLANLVIGGTILGAVATELRDISQGKNPAPLNGELLLRGMATSGTLAVFGDILASSGQHFGGGFTDRFFPPASMFEKASDLVIGNIGKALKGKETSVGKDALRFLQSITPGQNGWYTGLLMKRTIFEQLREMIDPKAAQSFKNQASKSEAKDQGFWWAPGETTPSSLPDPSTIIPLSKEEKIRKEAVKSLERFRNKKESN